MSEAVASAMALIREWRTRGDVAYQALGSLSALLAVASWERGERPALVLARVSGWLGADGLREWLTADAPPFLVMSSETVQSACLWAASAAVGLMAVAALVRGGLEPQETSLEVGGLFGARASASAWLLLLAATQQGPPEDARAAVVDAVGWISTGVAAAVALALLGVVLRRLGAQHLPGRLLRLAICLVLSVGGAVAAVLTTLVFVPFVVLWWLFSVESQDRRSARLELARDRARRDTPTGAPVSPPPPAPVAVPLLRSGRDR